MKNRIDFVTIVTALCVAGYVAVMLDYVMRANPQYGGNCRYCPGDADGDRFSRQTVGQGQPAAIATFPAVLNQLLTRRDITSLAAISNRCFALLKSGSLYRCRYHPTAARQPNQNMR